MSHLPHFICYLQDSFYLVTHLLSVFWPSFMFCTVSIRCWCTVGLKVFRQDLRRDISSTPDHWKKKRKITERTSGNKTTQIEKYFLCFLQPLLCNTNFMSWRPWTYLPFYPENRLLHYWQKPARVFWDYCFKGKKTVSLKGTLTDLYPLFFVVCCGSLTCKRSCCFFHFPLLPARDVYLARSGW